MLRSNEDGSSCVTKDNHFDSCFCMDMEISDNMPSNITGMAPCSASSRITEQATDSKHGDGQEKENTTDIIEDFSDLDSVYDTPEMSKMRLDLRRRIRLQKKHALRIQSLRRENKRLQKKIASYKQIIETEIKKETYIDNDTRNMISDNAFAAESKSTLKKKVKGSKRPVKRYVPGVRKFAQHYISYLQRHIVQNQRHMYF